VEVRSNEGGDPTANRIVDRSVVLRPAQPVRFLG
jgi:hypothetical protein